MDITTFITNFANQFDAQISVKPVAPLKLLRPWMYLAAMFLGVFFMSRIIYTVYNDNKIAAAENYELYVMTQVNDVENLQYFDNEASVFILGIISSSLVTGVIVKVGTVTFFPISLS